jgi:hypothetical protein
MSVRATAIAAFGVALALAAAGGALPPPNQLSSATIGINGVFPYLAHTASVEHG